MKISELADQLRNIPLREVLERYGFEAKPEGTTLRAKSEHAELGAAFLCNEAAILDRVRFENSVPISLRGLPSLKMIPG